MYEELNQNKQFCWFVNYECVLSLKQGQLASVCWSVMRHIVPHADRCIPLPILLLCNLQLSFHNIIHRLNRNSGPSFLAGMQYVGYCILQLSLQNTTKMNECILTWLVIIKHIKRESDAFVSLACQKMSPRLLKLGYGIDHHHHGMHTIQ